MNEILEYKEGKVTITDQALKNTPFYLLNKGDRSEDKKLFNDAVTFIFFMYSRESIYARRTPYQRESMILANVFHKDESFLKKLERLPGYNEAVEFFKEHQFSEEEWAFEQWKSDVDDYLSYLRKIPYTITVKKNMDGVLVDTEIDNSSVKMPAVKHFAELIELGKKLSDRVKESKKSSAVGKREKKMFEDPE